METTVEFSTRQTALVLRQPAKGRPGRMLSSTSGETQEWIFDSKEDAEAFIAELKGRGGYAKLK